MQILAVLGFLAFRHSAPTLVELLQEYVVGILPQWLLEIHGSCCNMPESITF